MDDVKIPITAKSYAQAAYYLPADWFTRLYTVEPDYVDCVFLLNLTQFCVATDKNLLMDSIADKYQRFNPLPYSLVGVVALILTIGGYLIFDTSPIYIGLVAICLFSLFNYSTSENIHNRRNISRAHDVLLSSMFAISDYQIKNKLGESHAEYNHSHTG